MKKAICLASVLLLCLSCIKKKSSIDLIAINGRNETSLEHKLAFTSKIKINKNTMERITIVGYKPFQGKEAELLKLMKTHWQKLDEENLVSKRKSIIMQSANGTIIEVFGWKSKEALELAHSNPMVQKMWEDYSKVCEYIPISNLEESSNLFSEFTPIN